MSMSYTRRMILAVTLSVLIHGAGFALLRRACVPAPAWPPPESAPIVLDLQPDPPPPPAQEPPRQLVDVAVPAPKPVAPTDRIAETSAESMDQAPSPEDNAAPALEVDEFDALPTMAARPEPPAPAAPPPPPKAAKKEPESPRKNASQPAEIEDPLDEVLDPDTVNERAESAPDAPMRVAQNTPAPPERPSPGMTRERGGMTRQGVTNFDAIQHEIAPYLKQVRERVERRWNEMLYTRYSGTSPAKAVIDCAISPDGKLVSVTVVGADGDRLYGALCKDAIQRAGPFGPFPFEVPAIYRDKNLEIRWTFNFL
jgi:outer membrane biosynthesis protein TonB